MHLLFSRYSLGFSNVPLLSPVHKKVSGDKRRDPVHNLSTASAPGVENGSVQSAGKRTLTVGGETICGDALLRLRAYNDDW